MMRGHGEEGGIGGGRGDEIKTIKRQIIMRKHENFIKNTHNRRLR